MSKKYLVFGGIVLLVVIAALVFVLLNPGEGSSLEAAKSYVPPGQLDQYYLFASGGHSGQVFVIGVPSMRRIRTIPVFSVDSATGWGFEDRSKKMLGDLTWGDAHHPALSETNGDYDGRWLFINDGANNRMARIDLRTFTTEQILGPVPNIMMSHASPFITPNSEYVFMGTRFGIPYPQGTYVPISEYSNQYHGVLTAVAIEPKSGEMSIGWQVKLPPWDFDLADSGKKASDGWAFFTTYNTEEATTTLEKNASKNDRDYLVLLNWREAEKAVKAGQTEDAAGIKMIDPVKTPGLVYLIPVAKSPHGVDVSPDGKYVMAAGKLQPTVTVYEFAKLQEAISKKDFAGEVRGLPVIRYESARVAEVPVGLGPLHTQFDDQGYAYTSLFLDSAITKWQLGTWQVKDKVQVAYNVGHLTAAEGDTVSPDGKYLVSLNKMAKDRFLSVGPAHPESMQLIDLTSPNLRVLYDAPVDPEPHYAQMIKADKIKPINVYPKDEKREYAVWKEDQARIDRTADGVQVYMYAIRSRFVPDNIEVNQGDKVVFHITNNDMDEDMTHGFGIPLYNIDMEIQPGETKTVTLVANKPGVFVFYCTNFCSALHQEMQGYLLVKPK